MMNTEFQNSEATKPLKSIQLSAAQVNSVLHLKDYPNMSTASDS